VVVVVVVVAAGVESPASLDNAQLIDFANQHPVTGIMLNVTHNFSYANL